CLPRAVVQLPGDVPPLHVLRLHEPPREVTQFRVYFLKFLSTDLHLGFECIRQGSIALLALVQLSLDLLTLGDVPGNFGRSYNLSAGVPDRRTCERDIKRCLVFPYPKSVEVLDSLTSLDSFDDDLFFVPAIVRDD